jgi:hypothetical protein
MLCYAAYQQETLNNTPTGREIDFGPFPGTALLLCWESAFLLLA